MIKDAKELNDIVCAAYRMGCEQTREVYQTRIEKLKAALRVYANEDHWSGDNFEPIMFPEGKCTCCYEHFSDQGEIARKALEGKDE
jgi:hypothetical protein